jgi:hypothetical protein
VRRYRHFGVVAESMKPLARIAQDELQAWVQDMGGPECVSAQERAVLEDCARLGLILRAQLLRFMRSDGNDRHAATSATTAAAARRASLQAVGLQRRAKEIDLSEYLQRKSAEKASEISTGAPPNALNGTNSSEDDPQPQPAEKAADARKGASVASGGGVPGGNVRPDPAAVSFTTQDEED